MKTIQLNDIILSEIKDYVETISLIKRAVSNNDYETTTYLSDERDSIARRITEMLLEKAGYSI